VAREVGTAVDLPVDDPLDEGVRGLPVGGDRGHAYRAVLIAGLVRLLEDGGAGAAGLRDALVDVRHLEGDVDDTVAVLRVVIDVGAAWPDGALDDEADGAGAQDEGLVV